MTGPQTSRIRQHNIYHITPNELYIHYSKREEVSKQQFVLIVKTLFAEMMEYLVETGDKVRIPYVGTFFIKKYKVNPVVTLSLLQKKISGHVRYTYADTTENYNAGFF